MNRKIISFLLLVCICIPTTGCWNRRELNEYSIVTAVGVDKSNEGYMVSIQVLNPGEIVAKKGVTHAPVTTYIATGPSVIDVFRKLTTESPRKLYFSHMKILVFGEELAKQGIAPILDFFTRGHEFRTDFFLLVAKGTSAQQVLSVLTTIDPIPADSLFSALQLSEKAWAPTKAVTIDEFINTVVAQGKNPVITGVEILGNTTEGNDIDNLKKIKLPTTLKISTIGVFKKDKLIGWLNETDSKGYNYITDNVKSTVATVSLPQGDLVEVEVLGSKVKINALLENEQPVITIDLKIESTVVGTPTGIDLSKEENIHLTEEAGAQRVKKIIASAIKTAQQDYSSDIFGFGEVVHRSNPKAWKKLKQNWHERFATVPVNIKTELKITGTGTKAKSFLEKIKE